MSSFTSTKPEIWDRYVDDVFAIMKGEVDALLAHLNARHPSIQFTTEREKDGKLPFMPFMDVSVRRTKEGQLHVDVYRRPTHTGRYLQYASNHPENVKKGVAMSLNSSTG